MAAKKKRERKWPQTRADLEMRESVKVLNEIQAAWFKTKPTDRALLAKRIRQLLAESARQAD